MKTPRYIVLITRGGSTEGHPARTLTELKEIMRWLQSGGFRTKVLRYDGKYLAYRS